MRKLHLLMFFLVLTIAKSQVPIYGEDCLNAIPICDPIESHPGGVGTGNYQDELGAYFVDHDMCIVQEDGGVWYTFTASTSGILNFVIDPVNVTDDYDWVVLDITHITCADLATNTEDYMLSASTAGDVAGGAIVNHGPTGISSALSDQTGNSDCNGPGEGDWNTFNPDVDVIQGNTYVLYVAQSSGTQGYELDFSASEAVIYDTLSPALTSMDPPTCNSTSITFYFSEEIQCSTVDDADFYFNGPGGPYTLTNITSVECGSGGESDNYLTADISPSITTTGTYTLGLDASIAGSVTDFCGNAAPSTEITIDIYMPEATVVAVADVCSGDDAVFNISGTADATVTYNINGGSDQNVDLDASGNASITIPGITSSTTINITSVSLTPDPVTTTEYAVSASGGTNPNNATGIIENTGTTLDNTNSAIINSGTPDITLTIANTVPTGTDITISVARDNNNGDISITDGTNTITFNSGPNDISQQINFVTGQATNSFDFHRNGGGTWIDGLSYQWTTTPLPCVVAHSEQATVNIIPCGFEVTVNDTTICEGDTANIFATVIDGVAPFTYQWDNGLSAIAGPHSVHPTTTTNYTVTVTDAAGVTVISTGVVTINAAPTPILTGNDFCQGFNTTLDAGAGYTSYSWSPGGFTTQQINVLTANTYNVTVIDANGCQGTGSITIAENPNPTPTISGSDFCQGLSSTLDAGAGYNTYAWSPSGSTQTITATTAGTYTVTVTDANGCIGTDDITIVENPNPTPTILGNDFCSGQTETIDAGTGYNSYVWSTTETSQTIDITTGGTYDVTVFDANGCQGTGSITLTENPLPTPTITGGDFCQGLSSTLDAGAGYNIYAWSSGGNTQTITATTGGTYTVTVTDANACSNNTSITIIENPLPTPTITGADFCTGTHANLDAGAGYNSYAWSTIETSQTIVISTGGTYSVTVTDANACEGTDDITIAENPLPTPTITGNDFCSGQTETLDAGAGYNSYAWNTTEISQTIDITTAGTYTVSVTDGNGCVGIDDITIAINPLPTPTITGNDFCQGLSSIIDAGAGYNSYTWSSGGTNQTITVTTAGTYTVSVTDANACEGTANITIAENPNPTPTITGNDFCAGSNSVLDAGTYTSWLWSTTEISQTITITTGGTFDVTVTDANGCIGSSNITITENANPTPTITGSLTFCTGYSTTLDAGAGYSSYTWNTTENTQTITVSSAGTYIVTVTDANGCSGTDQVDVNAAANLSPTITGVPSICNGSSTTIDAGVGYATYDWSTTENTQTISVGTAGTYSVTVTDVNGCSGDASITITENPLPIPTITGNDFCSGNNTLLNAGNTYSAYLWNTTETSSQITITNGGTYDVTVTDANGCEGSTNITITENPLPTPTISGNDFCNGSSETLTLANTYNNYAWNTSVNTATITVNTSGTYSVTVTDANGCEGSNDITLNTLALPTPTIIGDNFCAGTNSTLNVGTYSAWNWNTTETTQQITITTGGNYTVTVTDNNGCQASASINITEYPNPTPSINGYDFCAGLPADIYSDAGYASYVWSTTETTQLITVAVGGTYVVTVTDANSCEGSTSITIIEYPLPTPVIVGNDFCNGSTESLYTATSYAGYQWNTSQNTPLITINTGGTYAVTVIDANGCEASASTTISVLPLPTPTIAGNDFCQNTNTDLNAGVYNAYDWNTTETSQTINIATPGLYSVTVTDANGCEGSGNISIAEIPSPTPNITGDLDVCEGENSVLDAGSGYSSYIWSTSSNNQNISVTTTNTYSVTVSDANGCEGSTSVNFTVHPNPTPNIDGLTAICQGDNTSLDAGVGYSSYLWSTYETNQIINVDIAGQYAVTVTNDFGCEGSDLISVNVNNLTITASPSTTICGGTDIDISATILTGVPSYTYNWSNGFIGSTQNVSPDTSTTYSVYVVDGMGCVSETLSITIDVTPGVQLDLFTNKDTICPGDPLLITSLVQYGIPPYTIYDENNNIVSLNYITYPNASGDFIYTVIDACNSNDVDTITINFYPVPNLQLIADIYKGCSPLTVNFLESNINNNDGYSYVWDFDDINDNNLSLSSNPVHIFETAGSYDISLQVTTSDGCKTEATVYDMINVFPNPDAKFDVLPDVMTIIDPTFDFDNYSENAFSYIWNFDDGDTSNLFEPSHTYNYVGEYLVELIAISAQGCKDTAEHLIRVKDVFTLYVPTAFSPDYDGINDFFFVKGVGIDTDNFDLRIYDRWGELIWQSNDLFEKWDGHAKGGNKIVEIGTYTWLVTCKDFEGNEHQKAGLVTVIR